ncbi:MAG: restriction endonuclease subunit S [Bacteroidales bacterium]|nr:restriction endonuclease subunit S [Bacteroidales bacterium]
MNSIDKLVKKLHPDGVKWVKLGDHCDVLRGKRLTKSQLQDSGKYKVYHGGFEPIGNYDDYNREAKTIMVINVGASAGTVGFSDKKFWSSDGCFCLSQNQEVNSKFLYYSLLLQEKKIKSKVRNAGIPTLDKSAVEDIEIPLPDIKIQKEIVHILNSFTCIISKLDDAIKLRQKQYEYYREKLFGTTLENCQELESIGLIKLVSFNSLGPITRGKRFVRDDIKDFGQPCIHYGDMYTYYGVQASKTKTFLDRDFPKKMRYAKKGDVVIVGAGENNLDIGVGLAWSGEEPAVVHDACYILEHEQNPLYISYYLRTNIYHQQLKKNVSEGKICSFSSEGLGKVLIPIPSLDRQADIVDILDEFESTIEKLKKVKELRQKQYEYYREKLLTFEH